MRDRRVLGLGRVCVDEHYRREGDQPRWDGRKWSVRPAETAGGGSVPRILEVLAAFGAPCECYGTANPADAGGALVAAYLAERGVTARLRPCRRTARSVIVVDATDALHLVCSVSEDPDDRFPRASARDIPLDGAWLAVLDLRHLDAATTLAARCREAGVATFLDPGSSFYETLAPARVRALTATLDACCADEAFYDWLGPDAGIGTVLSISEAGETTARCHDGAVTVPVPEGERRGSTLGTGDYFRGGLLAGLLALAASPADVARPPVRHMAAALGLARQLATWRKTDGALLPRLPDRAQLANWRRALRA